MVLTFAKNFTAKPHDLSLWTDRQTDTYTTAAVIFSVGQNHQLKCGLDLPFRWCASGVWFDWHSPSQSSSSDVAVNTQHRVIRSYDCKLLMMVKKQTWTEDHSGRYTDSLHDCDNAKILLHVPCCEAMVLCSGNRILCIKL